MPDTPPSSALALETPGCDPTRAQAQVLSLFLVNDPAGRDAQLARIRAELGDAPARAVGAETEITSQLDRSARLPLLQSAIPALQALGPSATERLLATVTALTHRKGRISLTEHLFVRLLQHALQPSPKRLAKPPEPSALRRHGTLLLSVMAHAGHHADPVIADAFARGAASAPLDGLGPIAARKELRVVDIDTALEAMATTAQPFRDALVRALADTARHDGRVTAAEAELLDAIGTLLDSSAQRTAPLPGAPGVATADGYAPEIDPDEAALGLAPDDATESDESLGTDRLPIQALFIANLVPLVGVLLFDWDALNLLLLYWMENLVVGGYTLLRMLHTGGLKALFPAAFFTFHYSFFCAGHGFFIIAITHIGTEAESSAANSLDSDGMMPFGMLWNLLAWIADHSPGLLVLPLLAFVVSHGISTFVHHFVHREDAGRKPDEIMFDPYRRIVALHIAILLGTFAVVGSGAGSATPALIILVGAKIAIDLQQHRQAHRRRRAESQAARAEALDSHA